MPLAPNSGILVNPQIMVYTGGAQVMGMPRIKLPSGELIQQPHPEWQLNQMRWRWLVDSWEGGDIYRTAFYGYDLKGFPIRNLIRHKSEYPLLEDRSGFSIVGRPPGTDQYNQATDDDYELRRARTPVPGFLSEVVERHLSKIYKREVKRIGPVDIEEWWNSVDGNGTTIDQWMIETIAPLLLVLGQLDIILDHPAIPEGETVRSRADEYRLDLDSVVACYILPENLMWWEHDDRGFYEEVLIREIDDKARIHWRYWNKEVWCLYDTEGEMEGKPTPHDFGMVPILRLFDRRRPRCRNVGLPRYEMIAELQREYYNRDSELILSDTTQAHPLLQGPEDFVVADGSIEIGPNRILAKKKSQSGGSVSYEGFEVIEFPKGGADSIRLNLDRLRDNVDRLAGLTKPAGAQGSTGQTVSQSGISKQLDATTGHDLLGNISKTLERAERAIAVLFWLVKGDGKPNPAAIEATTIQYPAEFDLQSADDIASFIQKYQFLINAGGRSPVVEGKGFERLVKTGLSGLDDEEYRQMNDEIASVLAQGVQPEPEEPDESEEGR